MEDRDGLVLRALFHDVCDPQEDWWTALAMAVLGVEPSCDRSDVRLMVHDRSDLDVLPLLLPMKVLDDPRQLSNDFLDSTPGCGPDLTLRRSLRLPTVAPTRRVRPPVEPSRPNR